MLISKEGLFFIKIRLNKKPGINNVTFTFEFDFEE